MSVEAIVKIHIECAFRDEQKPGDDFELYVDHHSFWLNRGEVEELIERAQAVLEAYDDANTALSREPS